MKKTDAVSVSPTKQESVSTYFMEERTMAGYRKLGKTSSQRKALLRNQVTALLHNGKIVTTEARAKEVRKPQRRLYQNRQDRFAQGRRCYGSFAGAGIRSFEDREFKAGRGIFRLFYYDGSMTDAVLL